MPSNSDAVARSLGRSRVGIITGRFVAQNPDGTVVIDFDDGQHVTMPSVSDPPLVGDYVRVLRAGSHTVMLGKSKPRPGFGTVTGTGSPNITVTLTDGTSVSVPYLLSYSPVVGDGVMVRWEGGGCVVGKVSQIPPTNYVPPAVVPTVPVTRTIEFRPIDSHTWGTTLSNDDVWCTPNTSGAWFYGTQIPDTLPDTARIDALSLYVTEFYTEDPAQRANIGFHQQAARGVLAPPTFSAVPINEGTGWRELPASTYGPYMTTSIGGLSFGIGTFHGGVHKFRGRMTDPNSGLLRVTYTV